MPSFDIVSEVNQVEVRNAVDQANKEIGTRFDFKGSDARVEIADKALTLFADDDFKLKQVTDVLVGKLTKRGVDVRSLKYGDPEKISGNKMKQPVTVPHRRRAGAREEDRQAGQGQQAQGAGLDPGRCRARIGRQARRPAGGDRPGEEVDHRLSAAVPELPGLGATWPTLRHDVADRRESTADLHRRRAEDGASDARAVEARARRGDVRRVRGPADLPLDRRGAAPQRDGPARALPAYRAALRAERRAVAQLAAAVRRRGRTRV